MAYEIKHLFPVAAPIERVFPAVSTIEGLNVWWSKSAEGEIAQDSKLTLHFGPGYSWEFRVTQYQPNTIIEYLATQTDPTWNNTRVNIQLTEKEKLTYIEFIHSGWSQADEHFRTSSFCWAMYLRILKRNIEFGEEVPYENRLDA